MKCSICDKEIYYQESKWLFIIDLLVIFLAYKMEWLGIMTFLAVGSLWCSWVYNSQRIKKHNALHALGEVKK